MRTLFRSLSIAVLFLPAVGLSAQESSMTFELAACEVFTRAIVLVFENSKGNVRRVAFGDDDQLMVKTDTSKGLLSFSNTVAIRLQAYGKVHGSQLMTIEYRLPDQRTPEIFEAGVISSNCLKLLRERYGDKLKFEGMQ